MAKLALMLQSLPQALIFLRKTPCRLPSAFQTMVFMFCLPCLATSGEEPGLNDLTCRYQLRSAKDHGLGQSLAFKGKG